MIMTQSKFHYSLPIFIRYNLSLNVSSNQQDHPLNIMTTSPIHPESPVKTEPVPLLVLPTRNRGKHTEKFKANPVITNFFRVSAKPIEKIFIFSVKFFPQIPSDNSHLRMKLLNEILSQIKEQIPMPVLSGMNIYSTSSPTSIEQEYKCNEYKIKVKQVKLYDVSGNKNMVLTFLNNGLKNLMTKLGYVEIGKSGKFFNPKQKEVIDNLLMFSGYKANFVRLEKGIYLRVDPAKKIVRNETVLQFIDSFYQMHRQKDKEEKRNLLKTELIDKVVMSNYGKSLYYKICDIEFKEIESVILDGTTSLLKYYEEKYKIKVRNMKQPLLVTQSKDKEKPTYLIPELMLMTGIPDNFDQLRRKKVSQRTIKAPHEKLGEVESLMEQLKNEKEIRALQQIGLKLNSSVEKINAKQIPVPILELGKNNTVEKGKEAFFNLFAKPIFSSKHEINCSVIHSRNTDVKQLTEVFQRTSVNLGVKLNLATSCFNNASVSAIQAEIDKAIDNGSKICCIVIPMNLKNNYKNIKTYTIGQEIVTQVVTEGTLRKKGLQSIATKVLLQIIAKRGNILWVPRISVELPFSAMLVGFEQTKLGNKTVMAICATINSTFSLVFTCTKIFDGAQGKYMAMRTLLSNAIKSYVERNRGPPDEIICFQNSCTGDQVSLFTKLFAEASLADFSDVNKDHNLALTLVMINTKTNERFFFENGGKTNNVPAGTLVCQGLVSQNYDFYIMSQYSTRGTTVPNHYKVIYSNSKVEEGLLQQIAFSQCFNYVNWTGSIKVPSILQYAKKAAKFRAEVISEKEAPDSLQNKLYFV